MPLSLARIDHVVLRVRALAPTVPLLIPGVGAQGGDAVATVRAGWRADAMRGRETWPSTSRESVMRSSLPNADALRACIPS